MADLTSVDFHEHIFIAKRQDPNKEFAIAEPIEIAESSDSCQPNTFAW
jgi:hypothetical protein